MTHGTVTLPKVELGLIAATRAMLGVGIGLLVGEHLSDNHRKTLGWSLLLAGAISTIPLAIDVLEHRT
ncbi:MAG TPA: hypothetical protein VHV77_04510 [Pirellulales bacterium]|jgi:hypothetical protein|nr:hypothetical protein [Pirellulales bacterium]